MRISFVITKVNSKSRTEINSIFAIFTYICCNNTSVAFCFFKVILNNDTVGIFTVFDTLIFIGIEVCMSLLDSDSFFSFLVLIVYTACCTYFNSICACINYLDNAVFIIVIDFVAFCVIPYIFKLILTLVNIAVINVCCNESIFICDSFTVINRIGFTDNLEFNIF